MGAKETDLFEASLLDSLPIEKPESGYLLRPLRSTDYNKNFLGVMGQLMNVGDVSESKFLDRFIQMKAAGGHYVVVVEKLETGKVVGTSTLLIDHKFINNCSLEGRVGQLVVNKSDRGKLLGKLLMSTMIELAKKLGCYQLFLNCSNEHVSFYNNLGFECQPAHPNFMLLVFNN